MRCVALTHPLCTKLARAPKSNLPETSREPHGKPHPCVAVSATAQSSLYTNKSSMMLLISGRGFLGLSQNGMSAHSISEPSAVSSWKRDGSTRKERRYVPCHANGLRSSSAVSMILLLPEWKTVKV